MTWTQALSTALATAVLLSAGTASANLCKDKRNGGTDNPRYHREARQLKHSKLTDDKDMAGDDAYNATVIRCNRKRDNKRRKIQRLPANASLPANLPPRFVRGKIRYMGFAGLPYGYRLHRTNGVWHVTAAIRFSFPKRKKNFEVAEDAIKEAGLRCGKVYKEKDYNYCRVTQTGKVRRALMEFWRREIEKFWQTKNFKTHVKITNLGELSKAEKKAFRRKIWPVRFSLKHKRATYYPLPIVKQRGIPATSHKQTLRHEFGHWLGFDDEYEEFDGRAKRNPGLICRDRGGDDYIMCDTRTDELKAVYTWIVTRRYAIGGRIKGVAWCDRKCRVRARRNRRAARRTRRRKARQQRRKKRKAKRTARRRSRIKRRKSRKQKRKQRRKQRRQKRKNRREKRRERRKSRKQKRKQRRKSRKQKRRERRKKRRERRRRRRNRR